MAQVATIQKLSKSRIMIAMAKWPPYYCPFFKLLLHLRCKLLVDSVWPHIFSRHDFKNEFSMTSSAHKQCFVISTTQLSTRASCSCLRSIVKFSLSLSLSLSLKFPLLELECELRKWLWSLEDFFFRFIYLFLKNNINYYFFTYLTNKLLNIIYFVS